MTRERWKKDCDIKPATDKTDPGFQAFCWTESGRKCGNLSQPWAERSPETFPEGLPQREMRGTCWENTDVYNECGTDISVFALTRFNVSRSQLPSGIEMNSDEFTLKESLSSVWSCDIWYFIFFSIWLNAHMYTHETYKSGGVVVPDSFGITKSLQSRVGLDDLVLQGALSQEGPSQRKYLFDFCLCSQSYRVPCLWYWTLSLCLQLQYLQNTGWLAWCWQFFLHRILHY